ncbi:hypothetical protein ABBQ38_013198 [Trebouxia sp. C0009 RCD-2024]
MVQPRAASMSSQQSGRNSESHETVPEVDTSMNRLLRQYVRWHLRDADELKELLAELQQAQQAAAEAQEALLTVNGALLAAKQREEQQQGDLQAAVELHRQGAG